MNIEVTKKGVHDQDGKPIEIGTTISVQGDAIPAWLVNKGRVVAEKPKKAVAVTNDAPKTLKPVAKKAP